MPFAVFAFIFIKFFVPYKDQIKGVYFVNRAYIGVWAILCGFRFKFKNLSVIDKNQTYIVVANHSNIADIPGIAYGCRAYAKPLFKKEIAKIPFLGWLFSMSGIAIDRNTDEGRKKSLEIMRKELGMGISIFIFPEGTRNRTEAPLKKFHHGAFTLAIEGQVPILPFVLTGMRKISNPTSLLFRPGTITINYLDPIPTKGLTLADMDTLRTEVYNKMEAYLIANDDSFIHLRK